MDNSLPMVGKTRLRASYAVIFSAGMKNRDNHCGLPLPFMEIWLLQMDFVIIRRQRLRKMRSVLPRTASHA